jgi:Holliday junction DNA helicase RuvA
MIASLTGTVTAVTLSSVVLEVSGVGYLVSVAPKHALELSVGSEAKLSTALIVREDAFQLFGFRDQRELALFDLLRTVTGVGPKSALAVVGSVGPDEIANAVAHEDDAVFRRVSGIGPKTAKLITVTLAGKLQATSSAISADLVSALLGLGFTEANAREALRSAAGESDAEKLRSALVLLSSSKSGIK